MVRALIVVAVLWVVLPATAWGATCPQNVSIKDKLAGADVAFVGRVVAVTSVVDKTGVPKFDYRFRIDHAVKGIAGTRATVRAAKLVDLDAEVVTPSAVTIGVLATRNGARLVTSTKYLLPADFTRSCTLVDPGSLMAATDEPKGGGIKVLIGLVIAGLVVWYSVRRLKKRGGAPRPNPLG